MCFFLVLGIDGLVDMKHICGTIVARKRGKQGKEGKVSDLVVNKSPRKTYYSKQNKKVTIELLYLAHLS